MSVFFLGWNTEYGSWYLIVSVTISNNNNTVKKKKEREKKKRGKKGSYCLSLTVSLHSLSLTALILLS